MERDDYQPTPDELTEVAARLCEARPTLTVVELDQLRLRIRKRAARGSGRKGVLMKTRIAMVLMLALGGLLSVAGAGLALSGTSGKGSASVAQYGHKNNNNNNDDNNNNNDDNNNNDQTVQATVIPSGPNGTPPASGTLPGNENQVLGGEKTQAPRQATAAQELPFTGYAAIPIILIGLMLLTAGLITGRRVRRAQQLE
jgi:hypothetical protein